MARMVTAASKRARRELSARCSSSSSSGFAPPRARLATLPVRSAGASSTLPSKRARPSTSARWRAPEISVRFGRCFDLITTGALTVDQMVSEPIAALEVPVEAPGASHAVSMEELGQFVSLDEVLAPPAARKRPILVARCLGDDGGAGDLQDARAESGLGDWSGCPAAKAQRI
eukprot:179562-Prymnesium_polylepis.1